jgi:biotin transport system substrate-specific component
MHPSLLTVVTARADSRALRTAERAGAMVFITVLTAVASQVSVPLPFTPVPFTFQPLVVLLGGALLGSRLGMAAQVLYLALGLAGLPVFAVSPTLPSGAARLMGPTAGYLLSYPFAAFIAGWLAERGFDRRYLTSVLAMACGLAVVFAGGVLWLAFVTRAPRGLAGAVALGFTPFIVADLIKLLVAGAAMPALWWLVDRPNTSRY